MILVKTLIKAEQLIKGKENFKVFNNKKKLGGAINTGILNSSGNL